MDSRPRSRDHSPGPGDDADYHERWIQQALAGLQLPHMPQSTAQQEQPGQPTPSSPSIRILLVSDVDLPSASALAEYTLLQNNQVFDASRIDLCIACGPFCRDEDLLPYLKGKQRKQFRNMFEDDRNQVRKKSNQGDNNQHYQRGGRSSAWSSVFFRSQEETAAMEGLVTAAISQLESIVCRVVFCPGSTDPMSTSSSPDELRFTPNSRNVHRQWLPLAPGLGCTGLLFLDAPTGSLQVKAPPGRQANQHLDYDSDEEVDGDCHYDHHHHRHHHHPRGKATTIKLTKVHGNDGMGVGNYCRTLERLIQLAPPPQESYPFGTKLSQTILVTQYFQPLSNENERDGDDSEEDEKDSEGNVYGYRGGENFGEDDDTVAAGAANLSRDQPSASGASVNQSSSIDQGDDVNTVKMGLHDGGVASWPPEYSKFVESSLVQENLALEIASGGGGSQGPKDMQKGNVRIVIPGSLRERGEFCLVDMSLMEQAVKKNFAASTSAAASAKKKSTFAWRVRSVEFHSMERLP